MMRSSIPHLTDWERALHDLAVPTSATLPSRPHLQLHPQLSHAEIAAAATLCSQITRRHSKTFFLASAMLPPRKRRGVRALYAFCRTVDDMVDVPTATGDVESSAISSRLEVWRAHIHDASPDSPEHRAVWQQWRHAQSEFAVPHHFANQLIEGVQRDLVQHRYETFHELTSYCYGVACTVGLMVMHIVGFTSERDAIPYAIRLGTALQLTNILRDVGEDWQRGRVYLPQEELRRFGLSDGDIADGAVTHAWRAFMRFQIDRVRHLYSQAAPGIRLLHADGRFAVCAAAELYADILNEIERNDYDVFRRRAAVGQSRKLLRLPGIWWRAKRD